MVYLRHLRPHIWIDVFLQGLKSLRHCAYSLSHVVIDVRLVEVLCEHLKDHLNHDMTEDLI